VEEEDGASSGADPFSFPSSVEKNKSPLECVTIMVDPSCEKARLFPVGGVGCESTGVVRVITDPLILHLTAGGAPLVSGDILIRLPC